NADIAIEDNRIKSVGAKGSVPAGAKVFDVSGKTIVPGFIDTHAHWTEIRRGILDTQNWSFLANLAFGVTAGLDVQTGTNDMFAYQDRVERAGDDAHDRRRAEPEAQPDSRHRRLPRQRAHIADYTALQRRDPDVRQVGDRGNADPHRELRRAVRRGLLV